jgi:hypothetical protein
MPSNSAPTRPSSKAKSANSDASESGIAGNRSTTPDSVNSHTFVNNTAATDSQHKVASASEPESPFANAVTTQANCCPASPKTSKGAAGSNYFASSIGSIAQQIEGLNPP